MKYRVAHDRNFEIDLAAAVANCAHRMNGAGTARELAAKLAPARIVMLGESSHGTQEFYENRAALTRELIEHHGFSLIAIEGDWPPAQRLDDYIQGRDPVGADPLRGFMRWPTWMWSNTEIAKLAQWLRAWNETAPQRVAFFGLDVYSLFESIDETLRYLKSFDPFLAVTARERYECFAPFQRDEKSYAKSLIPYPSGCAREVTANLRDLLQVRLESGTPETRRQLFSAQQNARIVANAEDYYRVMVHGGEDSWNVRDRHMLETLEVVLEHQGPGAKAIVWAHNTHVGDYRATDMNEAGQINIGGLAREKWGESQVRLVGFGTFKGEVVAGRAWGGPSEVMTMPAGRPGSLEDVFHAAAQAMGIPSFTLDLRGAPEIFHRTIDHRAIGVVYNPAIERFGNYVPTDLGRRYDHFIFIDETSALVPIEHGVDPKEFPETWPQGV